MSDKRPGRNVNIVAIIIFAVTVVVFIAVTISVLVGGHQ